MNKLKNFFLFLIEKRKHWLPSFIIIVGIFVILILIGKANPILFFYS